MMQIFAFLPEFSLYTIFLGGSIGVRVEGFREESKGEVI